MKTLEDLCGGRRPGAMLFDLDGTLIDSAPDLADAVDFTLRHHGFAPAGEARVRQWVGNGARRLVRRALAAVQSVGEDDVDEALLDEALIHFFGAYSSDCCTRTRVYPGVMEALERWRQRGIAMACVTNKPLRFTERILTHYGLNHYLTASVSGDTLDVRKPDPYPLIHACDLLDVPVERAVMIGDSRNDVLAARAVPMPVVAVSYGYNDSRSVADERPDRVVDSLADLV